MSTSRPLIGITCDYVDDRGRYKLNYDYATAVEKAGGLPVALPYMMDVGLVGQLCDRLDGVLFSGGDDLDPGLFGEARHEKTSPLNSDRQRFELALLTEVERRRLPALGICLGSQMMNVHRGGSLHQFLPELTRTDPIEHRKLGESEVRHPVQLGDSAYQAAIGKREVLANSSHKQAVKKLGRGLRAIATSPDGIIEGVEDPTFPLFLGLQWHPERLHGEIEHLVVFKLLVKAAQTPKR